MLDRVLQILKSKNLSASKLADEIGVQRSGISHILSGRNKPSLEFIQKLLSHYPEIRTEWLLNGEGTMYKELHLFSPEIINNEVIVKVPKSVKPVEQIYTIEKTEEKTEPVIVSAPPLKTENQPVKEVQKEIRGNNEKQIEKILVFYSDKTFTEYKPEIN